MPPRAGAEALRRVPAPQEPAHDSPAARRRARRALAGDEVPRERILNAAALLFRERGYRRTTVRDIAERAGILSGSLFHHFRSKEEMLHEIMRDAALSVCVRAEQLVAALPTPGERLRGLIGLELECVVGEIRRDYHAVLFLEWREVPEPARPDYTALHRRYVRIWSAVLDDCRDAGLLRCEPAAALHVLHGAMLGTMTWFKPSGRYSLESFGDVLFELVSR